MVSLSTTLATNALVEGQGGRVALFAIGFDTGDLDRDGLPEALRGDPLIVLPGGHDHAGNARAPLDLAALEAALEALPEGLTGLAVAARFATRNPAHENAARDLAPLIAEYEEEMFSAHHVRGRIASIRRALARLQLSSRA